jgi:hypothetical protein
MSDDATTQAKPVRRNSSADDPLAGTQFEGIGEVYFLQTSEGTVQERAPTYEVMAPGFYGTGRLATYYEETSIIVGETPNDHLWPRNRAGAIEWLKWQASLPHDSAPIDREDYAEAAQMLAADAAKMNKFEWNEAVSKLAQAIKLKRLGGYSPSIPRYGHNFVRTGKTQAPPILGAKIAEMGERLPGQTRYAEAIPASYAPPRVRTASQPMNMPNGR